MPSNATLDPDHTNWLQCNDGGILSTLPETATIEDRTTHAEDNRIPTGHRQRQFSDNSQR